jgi:hypothetical protein
MILLFVRRGTSIHASRHSIVVFSLTTCMHAYPTCRTVRGYANHSKLSTLGAMSDDNDDVGTSDYANAMTM